MDSNTFLTAIATWAAGVEGITEAQVYELFPRIESEGDTGYGGLAFDVPAVFVHAFDSRLADMPNAIDYDNEITLALWTSGETRRADARALCHTLLEGLVNNRYGQDANLVDLPRLDGEITDQTDEAAEGEGLSIYTITYHQVFRSVARPGVAFNRRF